MRAARVRPTAPALVPALAPAPAATPALLLLLLLLPAAASASRLPSRFSCPDPRGPDPRTGLVSHRFLLQRGRGYDPTECRCNPDTRTCRDGTVVRRAVSEGCDFFPSCGDDNDGGGRPPVVRPSRSFSANDFSCPDPRGPDPRTGLVSYGYLLWDEEGDSNECHCDDDTRTCLNGTVTRRAVSEGCDFFPSCGDDNDGYGGEEAERDEEEGEEAERDEEEGEEAERDEEEGEETERDEEEGKEEETTFQTRDEL